ncbi:NAD(P)-binding protein [bacterium]|nr:NAD(P)-binding protein [bacterium]
MATCETSCCIVGAGPAGVILALLLARKGVAVTLLEAHADLDRDFRGDTVHPSTLELIDQLGLIDKLLALPHRRMDRLVITTDHGRETLIDFSRIHSKYPFVALMPQAEFLQLLVDDARLNPNFCFVTNANVQQLVREDSGVVQGVQYSTPDGNTHEVRANVVIGADGRFSRLRKLAGFEPQKFAPPMDILWFRVPRQATDSAEDLSGTFFTRGGHLAVVLERPGQEWQIGYVILKGSYHELKAQGIEQLRADFSSLVPGLADRANCLHDFRDVTVLSVEVARIDCWHLPGLLLIGDAAHVMSPVGGIGIQYAVQDAIAAANILTAPLLNGQVTEHDLAAVQKKREPAIRAAQRFQTFVQSQIVAQALRTDQPFHLPLPVRLIQKLPLLRRIPGSIIGHGFHQVHWQG